MASPEISLRVFWAKCWPEKHTHPIIPFVQELTKFKQNHWANGKIQQKAKVAGPPKGHMDISIERSKSNSERCLKEGNEERRIHFVEIRRKQSSEKGKDEITTRWGSTLWSDVVKNVQSVGSVHWCLIFCTLGTWVRQGCLCVVNIEHDDEIPYRHKVAEWRNKNHRNLQAL